MLCKKYDKDAAVKMSVTAPRAKEASPILYKIRQNEICSARSELGRTLIVCELIRVTLKL